MRFVTDAQLREALAMSGQEQFEAVKELIEEAEAKAAVDAFQETQRSEEVGNKQGLDDIDFKFFRK